MTPSTKACILASVSMALGVLAVTMVVPASAWFQVTACIIVAVNFGSIITTWLMAGKARQAGRKGQE